MKKMKLEGKLSLGKERIAKLSDEQMQNINGGGFTYSLSLGSFCKLSKKLDAGNTSECNEEMAHYTVS